MEPSDYIISSYCLIRKKRIILNGKKIIEQGVGASFPDFLSSVYKTFGSEHPRFYKMDLLCKADPFYKSDQVAMVVSNSQSSLETDAKYLETIADPSNYYPNPGLFVYTLPNLLIGEVSIKYQFKGESIFFVSQQPDFNNLYSYTTSLLNDSAAKAVIFGWVDLDFKHDYESALFLVENGSHAVKAKENWLFSIEAMEDLYFEKNLEE